MTRLIGKVMGWLGCWRRAVEQHLEDFKMGNTRVAEGQRRRGEIQQKASVDGARWFG